MKPSGFGRADPLAPVRRWLALLVLALCCVWPAAAQTRAAAEFDHLRTGFALTGQHASTRCESCHHSGVLKGTPRECAACHVAGQRFSRGNTVMPGNHLQTTSACDQCHGTRSFTGVRFNHQGVQPGSCASCHNGSAAAGKTPSHVATQASCDACHRAGAWLPLAGFDHASVGAGSCNGCHNGTRATGTGPQHIPTTGASACDSCHKSFTAWRPTAWNHSQVVSAGRCASCHDGQHAPADGKPAAHPPTQGLPAAASLNCDGCHKGSVTTWANGRLHANVAVDSGCSTCHGANVLAAAGKPSTPIHASVTGNCESCHKSTSTWSGAKVDHSTFNSSTNCASCHNGSTATGKPVTHVPVGSSNCFNCHNTSGWLPSKWNHTQLTVTGQCASCHTGGYPPADGRSANHIPYLSVPASASANCDSCHKSGYGAWTPAKFHASFSVSSACATCHSGGFPPAVGKPSTPIHASVTGNCESCHKSTSTWSGAKVDHSTFNSSTNCASCHNGSTATGKPVTHVPVGSSNCFNCHNTSGWLPSKWNHTQLTVTGQCASCHTGGYPPADGRSANHIPYLSVPASASANCDSCHKSGYGAWTPAKFHASFSVSSACATCHSGGFPPAVGKPSTPIHASVTGNCESCHKSTSTWSGAKVDHSTFNSSTNCASCHNGSTATGKPVTHVPVGSSNCFNCHSTSGWVPSKWNHTQLTVTGQCASCHTGGYPPADGRSANHIPYLSVPASASANCDSCHKSGYGAWTPAKFHASFSVSSACATCHSGGFPPAVGKPSTPIHASVTGNCESCHKSTSTWSGAKVDHSTFNSSTNCASCHNGSTATGKPVTHVPVGSSNCFNCHNTSGWLPSKWNHTQLTVTGQCASCHTGGYPPADGRPGNHVPYQSVPVTAANNCDACHRGSTTTWANGKVHAYASVSSHCASCHTGSYLGAVGKPNNQTHASVTGNCESCHKSTSSWAANVDHSTFNSSTNCASCHNGSTATGKPVTHVPVGSSNCFNCHNTSGWLPSKWNHTQLTVTGQCASCHTGGYPPADGRPGNHVPYQSVPVTAANNCDACHRGSTTTWANGKVHAYASLSSHCASCHTGSYLGAVGKPNNQTHASVTGNCESCHKSTSSWAANVDHSTFNSSTNCASCHNGSTATGKPVTHVPVGSSNCFNCHNTSGWLPSKWNHTQLTVTGQCASCHTGGYPPADGRPGNHVPYQSVPVTAANNCDACHRGSTTTWANGKVHAYASLSSHCASCHTGSYLGAVGKPNNQTHASVTGNCESCHKSTSSWAANFTHAPGNQVGSGTCDTCHNGSTATGKPGNHIPIPTGPARCDACHKSQTGWKNSLTMNHSVVTGGTCKSCHGGGYTAQGATAKPTNHIPELQLLNGAAMDCNACHTSTSSFGSMRMNHNNSQGNGAGWCKACHDKSTNYAGGMEKKSLTHEKSTGVTDCSQSGCHRPLGNKGSPYTKWN
jgi:hypothetical protein